jgi:hypothetical protein
MMGVSKKACCYSYPFVQTGTEYINVPKPKETQMVIKAYAYALQGCLLSLIALNSAMKVDTVLRQPKNPSCMPDATVSQVWVFTYTKINQDFGHVLCMFCITNGQ